MANSAILLTGQATASGNLPFLLYESIDQSKPQPLIIFLHGAGEGGFDPHDLTTVRDIEQPGVGIMALTKTASLPTFTDPITGENFDFFMIAPQQYYPPGTGASGVNWWMVNITATVAWAKANRNIDHKRIYITGLSLGGGGTITALFTDSIRHLFAAAACCCPGYGHSTGLDHTIIAKSGLPLWIAASANDTILPGTNPPCVQIVNRIHNLTTPLLSVKFYWYATGGHTMWGRMYDVNDGGSYLGENGLTYVNDLSLFRWFLQFKKIDDIPPFY